MSRFPLARLSPPGGLPFRVDEIPFMLEGEYEAMSLIDRIGNISRLTPKTFGAVLDGVTDDTTAFERLMVIAAATGAPIDLGSGTAKLTRQIVFPADIAVTYGHMTLDFSSISALTGFANGLVYIAGDAAVQVNDLNGDVVKGAAQLVLTSASSVLENDVLLIHNPADGTYSGFRTYYHAGEMCEVRSVSGATIDLYSGLYAAYAAADVNVYRLSRKTSTFSGGKLRILAPDDAPYGIHFENLVHPSISNVEVQGAAIAIDIDKCYGARTFGLVARQNVFDGSSNYGLLIDNCQNFRSYGNDLVAYKHACTTGGADAVAAINRDIYVEGVFTNLYAPASGATIGSVSAHGNTEHYHFSGLFNGGVQVGGNFGKFSGTIRTHDTTRCSIGCAELLGFDHDISGVTIVSPLANPSTDGRSTIDISANNTAIDENTLYGGTFRLNNISVDAPAGTRLLDCDNFGYVGSRRLTIDMRGMNIVAVSGASGTMIRTVTTSGTDCWTVLLDDVINEPDCSMSFSAGTQVKHPYGLKVPTQIAAATTLVLDNMPAENIQVSGNTQIDAITLAAGQVRTLRFTGTPQVTNGASLVVEGGTRTFVANDIAVVRGYASGVVRMSWTTGYSA